ncbi:MAG: hypothetical protein U0M21_08115 [Emergencia sp.]|nr:hypothetical protein [Emergencia sp.]
MLSSSIIFNSFVLLFITSVLGLLFGKIKVGRLSLGSSGALFVGLVIGYFVMKAAKSGDVSGDGLMIAETGKIVDGRLFTMALIFFVSSVGLQAAKNIGTVIKKYGLKFVALGAIITLIGAAGAYTVSGVAPGANVYSASGIYTGALTSSPGLAAAIENAANQSEAQLAHFDRLSEKERQEVLDVVGVSAETFDQREKPVLSEAEKETYRSSVNGEVGMGYAVAYPFGVIVVILAMNLFPLLFGINVEKERQLYCSEMKIEAAEEKEEEKFDLIGFGLVCFSGYLLGMIKFPLGFLGDVSLEVTGGVLIMALVLGFIGKIGKVSFRMNDLILDVIREIAVVFFLAIVGLNYGYSAISALADKGAVMAISAVAVAVIAIFIGFLVGRYVFKINWIMLAGGLCGGMTSTPGLGAAIEATESEGPAGGYGAAYPFALMGMILFTIILYLLPPL